MPILVLGRATPGHGHAPGSVASPRNRARNRTRADLSAVTADLNVRLYEQPPEGPLRRLLQRVDERLQHLAVGFVLRDVNLRVFLLRQLGLAPVAVERRRLA